MRISVARILRNASCALLLFAAPALAARIGTTDWVQPAPVFVDRCLGSLQVPERADISAPSNPPLPLLALLILAGAIAYRSPLYVRCYRYLFGPPDRY